MQGIYKFYDIQLIQVLPLIWYKSYWLVAMTINANLVLFFSLVAKVELSEDKEVIMW